MDQKAEVGKDTANQNRVNLFLLAMKEPQCPLSPYDETHRRLLSHWLFSRVVNVALKQEKNLCLMQSINIMVEISIEILRFDVQVPVE